MEKIKQTKTYKTMIEALYVPPFEEPEFGPSMVEPCHNLSIEEILADFSRGVVHTERQSFYDDGDDIPDDFDDIEDIVDLQVKRASSPDPGVKPGDGAPKTTDAGKPSDTSDAKQSDKEEGKEGTGAEE